MCLSAAEIGVSRYFVHHYDQGINFYSRGTISSHWFSECVKSIFYLIFCSVFVASLFKCKSLCLCVGMWSRACGHLQTEVGYQYSVSGHDGAIIWHLFSCPSLNNILPLQLLSFSCHALDDILPLQSLPFSCLSLDDILPIIAFTLCVSWSFSHCWQLLQLYAIWLWFHWDPHYLRTRQPIVVLHISVSYMLSGFVDLSSSSCGLVVSAFAFLQAAVA